jgi:levansucrase
MKRKATIPVNTKLKTTSTLSAKMYKVTYKSKKGYIKKSNLGTKKISKQAAQVPSNPQTDVNTDYISQSSNPQNEAAANNINQSGSTRTGQTTINTDQSNTGNSSSNQVSNEQQPSNTNLPDSNQPSQGNGQSSGNQSSNENQPYTNTYGTSQITRYAMSQIPNQERYSQFKVPAFDASTIENIPSAKKDSNSTDPADMDVWDSWPLQNADGTLAEYKGYHLVFAMAGRPHTSENYIYLFYQKVGEHSLNNWKNAGRVFKEDDHLKANDEILKTQAEEWSGSAILTKDGKVRLFYTDRQGWDPAKQLYGKQTLTTTQVNLSQPTVDTFKVDGLEDLKSIFDGDGEYYQNVTQSLNVPGDDHCLRDPHYIEDEAGHKYLVFEANTGTKTGYQGTKSLYNKAYYGGGDNYFNTEFNKLLASNKKDQSAVANGALGIIELNNDYTVKKVMNPLITSNLVSDEIERPNVFKFHDKWYLFTATRGNRFSVDGIDVSRTYMLGYVSDKLTGPYKPLNTTGLVLSSDESYKSRTFTYSYFNILPSDLSSHNVVVTSYMTERGTSLTDHTTFAPSFLLTIDGEKTQVRSQDILEQGQLTTDKSISDRTKESDVSGNEDKTVKDPEISDGDETSGSETASGVPSHIAPSGSY